MAKTNSKTKAKDLSNLFLYKDEKGRVIYCDPIYKCGYVISDSDAPTFSLYSNRIFFAIDICLIVAFLLPSIWWLGPILGVVFYVILTYMFYNRFLFNLPIVKDFKKPNNEKTLVRFAKDSSLKKIIFTIVISFLLAILIYLNARKENYTGLTYYANIGIVFIFIIYTIYYLILLIIKQTNK